MFRFTQNYTFAYKRAKHTLSSLCHQPIKNVRLESTKDTRTAVGTDRLTTAGFLHKSAAGIFVLSPLATRIQDKICKIIRKHMEDDPVTSVQCNLPILHNADLWKKTGRWDQMGEELFQVKDRKGSEYCLSPTHEEMVTSYVTSILQTYRQLPIRLYQIDRKFRDEIRPAMGLYRGREFLMKDLYCFDENEEQANITYEAVKQAYFKIMTEIGIKAHLVAADNGTMGGSLSHEVVAESNLGKDKVVSCEKCSTSVFTSTDEETSLECATCNGRLRAWTGVELGHMFMLPTKYSTAFNCTFRYGNNMTKEPVMSCYGLGVSRMLATIAEVFGDKEGLRLPCSIAPYRIVITQYGDKKNGDELLSKCFDIREKLSKSYPSLVDDIVIDDRKNLKSGQRITDLRGAGFPVLIGLGRELLRDEQSQNIEIRFRDEQEVHRVNFNDISLILDLLKSKNII